MEVPGGSRHVIDDADNAALGLANPKYHCFQKSSRNVH